MQHIKSHFKKVDPILYPIVKDIDFTERLPPIEQKLSANDYYKSLMEHIASQQLSTKAADAIWGRFINLLNNSEIHPEVILKLEDQKMRDIGLSWGKIKYINDLSQKILDGVVKLNELPNLSDNEVIEELTQVKGIGTWTAEMFLLFTLRREDIFSPGDLALRKGVEKVYNIENVTLEQMSEITLKWSPFRSYGSLALWKAYSIN